MTCVLFLLVYTCMVNVVFSYFLLSPRALRRVVVLTSASGRFIQGSELDS